MISFESRTPAWSSISPSRTFWITVIFGWFYNGNDCPGGKKDILTSKSRLLYMEISLIGLFLLYCSSSKSCCIRWSFSLQPKFWSVSVFMTSARASTFPYSRLFSKARYAATTRSVSLFDRWGLPDTEFDMLSVRPFFFNFLKSIYRESWVATWLS